MFFNSWNEDLKVPENWPYKKCRNFQRLKRFVSAHLFFQDGTENPVYKGKGIDHKEKIKVTEENALNLLPWNQMDLPI